MQQTPSSCHVLLRRLLSGSPAAAKNALSAACGLKTFRHTAKRLLASQVPRPYVDPKWSYAFGRSNENLVHETVARALDRRVGESPNYVAYINHAEKKKTTFKELNEDVNRLAKSLVTKFGIKKGDFVGVFAYNCYNWILIQFACSKVGAVLTPINPSYKSHELAFVLKKGKIKCLFLAGPKSIQRELNNHLAVLQSNECVELANSGSGNNSQLKLEHVILMDDKIDYDLSRPSDCVPKFKLANCKLHNWSATCDNDALVFRSEQEVQQAQADENSAFVLSPDFVSPDDLFAVYYTSGTTGKPKGACVSQFTVMNNVRMCQLRIRNARPRNFQITAATTLPFFHIFAGVLNLLSPLVSSTSVVNSSHRYDIGEFVSSIIENNANLTSLTPTILIDMLEYIKLKRIAPSDVPLRIIQPGGAALPPELVSKTFKVLPQLEEVRCGYGSTENGSVATVQTIHEPNETRALSVGPPLDFTEVRIVEPNSDDKLVELGKAGEIQTRGFNTMVEYLDDPAKTREVLGPNRWYKTGDIGTMFPHGSLQICSRLKHMIIKGGENVYPEEVEQIMHKLECVEKVHVVGVPDKRYGEQVCAWIKLKTGYFEAQGDGKAPRESPNQVHKRDIVEFCKQNMTYFKVPKYILFVQEFPTTPTKKVQNHLMVEQSIKLLGLQEHQVAKN